MSYPESLNIFPNRPHWDENGVFTRARNKPPVCSCPEQTTPPTNLCTRCQEIRLRHLIFCEADGRMVDLGRLDEMIKRPNCDLCSLFVLGCKQTWQGVGAWSDAEKATDTTCFINALELTRQQPRGYALHITERHGSKPFQWLEFEIIYNRQGSLSGPVKRTLETCPKVDFGLLKTMLWNCEMNHTDCNSEAIVATPEDMFVINLKEMRIVRAPPNCRYVTLSYVWGKPSEKWLTLTRGNSESLREKGSLQNAYLPRTIRDAMKTCSEIDEIYFWVDSLCIVQDDPISQKHQIDMMDTIYASAVVSIVAAAGNGADSGLPGVSTWLREAQRQTITIQDIEVSNTLPRIKDTVNRSVWNTRGWTYQERMFSRRYLLFTESQAYFACFEGVVYERKNRLLPTAWTTDRFRSGTRTTQFIELFTQNVTDYTLRVLTSEGDILRAFQGVMSDMSKKHNQTFYFGIPGGIFEDALLWQEVGRADERVAQITLPTWTWASMSGPIKYTFKEERVHAASSPFLPAYWPDSEKPSLFQIDWLLNVDRSKMMPISRTMALTTSSEPTPSHDKIPENLYQLALLKAGRLLFSTQHTFLNLRNSVPYTSKDSWWIDYTADIDLTAISIISILLPGNGSDNLAGFIEMDKVWIEQNLQPENEGRRWDFIAISLATSKVDDYMHMYLTQLRNTEYPLVWSRNVRQLLVNVMLIEWHGNVARRLGVGKVFLDMWERGSPEMKWIILE